VSPQGMKTMMEAAELRSKFSGVIAFPVTPFKSDLTLDLEGLRHNLTKLTEQPICAVVAAGGTGEMFSLTPEEQLRVIQTTVEVIAGKAPVLAGVGFNQPLAVQMAQAAEDCGADGILALPPYYPQADNLGMLEYYRAIGRATRLGMLIYSRDWAVFSAEMVERLTSIPTLIAWKDGQGDVRRYQMIINRLGDRLCWIGGAGDDTVPGYYSIGVRAYTSSIATVAPRLSLKLHELAAAAQTEGLMELMHSCVIPLYALRARRKGYEVSAMKAMMDMVGLTGGAVRPPLVEVTSEERQELRRLLAVWRPFL
jgi:5-dehydro-4-deoxyglucarate dehydratase